jgi:acetyl esterase/lipase
MIMIMTRSMTMATTMTMARIIANTRIMAKIMAKTMAVATVLCLCLGGCSFVEFGAANAPDVFAGVKRYRDVHSGEDPRQRLDVYAPRHAVNRPVVIFWYGGTWVTGSKEHYRFVGITLAEHGIVAVLPDYRLYPQVSFPAFDADGANAVAWVERHVREYGGNPADIVLMGHSAGGHTAAFLALNHAFLRKYGADPACISGLVGLSGTYVLVPDTDELRATFPPPYTEADWQPIRFVDAEAPPTLLLHGLADREVAPQEAQELYEALMRAHVPVQLHLYPHRGHAATVAPFALLARWRSPALTDSLAFIDSLKPRAHCSAGTP